MSFSSNQPQGSFLDVTEEEIRDSLNSEVSKLTYLVFINNLTTQYAQTAIH